MSVRETLLSFRRIIAVSLRPQRVVPTLAQYKTFRSERRAARRLLLIPLMLLFCMLYGAAFAVLGQFLLPAFAIPLLVLALLIIWALPDKPNAPLTLTGHLFLISVISTYVWPNYLAIALPGLPWITVSRLVGIPLVILSLICLSTSKPFRSLLASHIRAAPALPTFILVFFIIQLFSIVMSANRTESINKLTPTLMMMPTLPIAVYLFAKPGGFTRFIQILWGVALFVGGIGVWQYKLRHLPWAGHTPSFLKVNDPVVQQVLSGYGRNYTAEYRTTSTFVTPLGLSEFLALLFPFIIYMTYFTRRWPLRLLGLVTAPFFVIVIILTGSRLGMLGCFLSACLLPGLLSVKEWLGNKRSLLAPFVVAAYPVLFTSAVALTFLVGRLRTKIWGGGAQQSSTQSRRDQYHLGLPIIFRTPLGHGAGRGAQTLNYAPFGFLTIDSYYLVVALEYGVAGFIVFYGMVVFGIIKSGRLAMEPSPQDSEQGLMAPLCVSLAVFFVIKGVFAQPDNLFLMYFMLMALISIGYRVSHKEARTFPGSDIT